MKEHRLYITHAVEYNKSNFDSIAKIFAFLANLFRKAMKLYNGRKPMMLYTVRGFIVATTQNDCV